MGPWNFSCSTEFLRSDGILDRFGGILEVFCDLTQPILEFFRRSGFPGGYFDKNTRLGFIHVGF